MTFLANLAAHLIVGAVWAIDKAVGVARDVVAGIDTRLADACNEEER